MKLENGLTDRTQQEKTKKRQKHQALTGQLYQFSYPTNLNTKGRQGERVVCAEKSKIIRSEMTRGST